MIEYQLLGLLAGGLPPGDAEFGRHFAIAIVAMIVLVVTTFAGVLWYTRASYHRPRNADDPEKAAAERRALHR